LLDAALKRKNIRSLTALVRSTTWLNRLSGQISRCAISQFVVLPQNILRDQAKLINYEALMNKYYETVYVLLTYISSTQIASFLHSIMWSSVASGSITFCHIILQTARTSEKVKEHNMCVVISSTKFV
jgi:hypothetical protein